jgi:uroporphyrinogen decarboxylase
VLKKLNVDYVLKVEPRYVGPRLPRRTDVFGCKFNCVDYGSGVYEECVYSPLAGYRSVTEIVCSYRWPSPDWWDYSDIPRQIKGEDIYPLLGGGSEPFLIYKNLRGQEQAFIDLIENPEMAHYCLDKLFGLAYTNTVRVYEQIPGKVLLTYVAEDMGGQNDLMFSPAHIRDFLLPGMKRMIDLAHQAGAFVFHHNDGNCSRIIPDMIAAGIDILNPIQWRSTGMDRRGLKRDFGSQIIFHGAMDNQRTLPFGSCEDVRREVLENLSILGGGGGYILAPCHNIQPITPPENIVAMYEAGREYGWG